MEFLIRIGCVNPNQILDLASPPETISGRPQRSEDKHARRLSAIRFLEKRYKSLSGA